MKRQRIFYLGLISIFLTSDLYAQKVGKIENGFDVEKYPEVSFVYHSDNPAAYAKADFWYLKESGKGRDFQIEALPVVIDSLPQNTLILWEDMAHNGKGQFDFTQNVLSGFFTHSNIPPSDKFAVAVFNRRQNNPTALNYLTQGFTSNKSQILSAIRDYKPSTERYPQFSNRSDMYTAIREGLDILKPLKGTKAIIVFTAGYSMKNSGSDSEAQVLLQAQKLHIPIYIYQYYFRSGVAPESEGFAKSTYGDFNSYMEAPVAERALLAQYPQIKKRYQGHDYKVTFTTDAERGSEARMIVFAVDGIETSELLVPPPSPSTAGIGVWIKDHLWLIIIISVVLLSLITCLFLILRKTKKKAEDTRRHLDDLKNQHEAEIKEAAEKQRERENRARQEKEDAERKAEESRLNRLMEVKNIYPRLNCREESKSFVYQIDKPVISIGRATDNDLVFSNVTVSGHHAEIVFNGSGFEIIDKKSTNKVNVNGRNVDRIALRNGDIITLGEVVITFYM